MKVFELSTDHNGLFEITPQVTQAVEASGITAGIVVVSVPHSTAAITVVSPWDPAGLEDIDDEIRRLIPTRVDFKHQFDTPQDAAGHIKAAIVGHSRSFCVDRGSVVLGSSQKIFFWEFDSPRSRTFHVQVVGTSAT
jgi:secondary thiamine-phosphate synthase enzyme